MYVLLFYMNFFYFLLCNINLLKYKHNEPELMKHMVPWFRGFEGQVLRLDKGRYKTKCVFQKIDDESMCYGLANVYDNAGVCENPGIKCWKRRALSRYLWFPYSHK